MLLFIVSYRTITRNTIFHLSCKGIHICMAKLMFTDAILKVPFFDMKSQVLGDSLQSINEHSAWCFTVTYLVC